MATVKKNYQRLFDVIVPRGGIIAQYTCRAWTILYSVYSDAHVFFYIDFSLCYLLCEAQRTKKKKEKKQEKHSDLQRMEISEEWMLSLPITCYPDNQNLLYTL